MADRVKLGVRVDQAVKEEFEERILEMYPQKRPYAGILLERELKFELERGEIYTLYRTINELESKYDHEVQKKETPKPPQTNDRLPIQYKVDSEVKKSVKRRAEASIYRSTGRFVESIMWRFVSKGSVVERLSYRVESLVDTGLSDLPKDEDMTPQKRRALEIESLLDTQFTLDDFRDACEEAGYGPSDHRTKTYLPIILEHRNYTWHPNNPRLFVSKEEDSVPKYRDPRKKLYIFVDEDDIKEIILIEIYKRKIGHINLPEIGINEIIDICQGKPRKTTVRPLMRDLATKFEALNYISEREVLQKRQELLIPDSQKEKFESILENR